MKTRAAVLWGRNQDWKVEEIDLDPPRTKEVLVKWEAAGLCHSDEHMVTGDMMPPGEAGQSTYPIIGGRGPRRSGHRRRGWRAPSSEQATPGSTSPICWPCTRPATSSWTSW